MHDPHTLAFNIKLFGIQLVTIWHVDPERDGTDDSCDWFNRGKAEDRSDPRRLAIYEALWDMETLLDNRPHYPDSPEHQRFQPLKKAIRDYMRPTSRWWFLHPRWHFWHWSFQVHPLQQLQRRLFDKCCVCGGKFKQNEPVISNSWHTPRRRWFEFWGSSRDIRHDRCSPMPAVSLATGPN